MNVDDQPRRFGWALGFVNKPRLGLILCLILVGVFRLSLIQTGHFYWGDERRYVVAEQMVDDVLRGNFSSAIARPYTCMGRPGFVVVSAVPVLLQRVTGRVFGLKRGTLAYYDAASVFNVFVTLAMTVVIFALGNRWAGSIARSGSGSGWYALLMAGIFSVLSFSNVWVRHMMPYHEALLLFLIALWVVSRPGDSDKHPLRTAIFGGLLGTMGYTCYPAYYTFVIINAAVLTVESRRRVRSIVAYGLSSLAVLVLFEMVAQLSGQSYFGNVLRTSGVVALGLQGSFGEGFIFAWHYLHEVEGALGVALFVLFMAFVCAMVWSKRAGLSSGARAAMIVAVFGYLLHATLSVYFHKTVFYGRIFGMYLPFVVMGAVLAIALMPWQLGRRVTVTALLTCAAVSFGTFVPAYSRMIYPLEFLHATMNSAGRDVAYPPHALWDMKDGAVIKTGFSVDSELIAVTDALPVGTERYTLIATHEYAHETKPPFIAVNLNYMWVIPKCYDRFNHPSDYELMALAPHPEHFVATGFESRTPHERQRFRERGYMMRIYQRTPTQRAQPFISPNRPAGADVRSVASSK